MYAAICRHCSEVESDHSNQKCLWDSTYYARARCLRCDDDFWSKNTAVVHHYRGNTHWMHYSCVIALSHQVLIAIDLMNPKPGIEVIEYVVNNTLIK